MQILKQLSRFCLILAWLGFTFLSFLVLQNNYMPWYLQITHFIVLISLGWSCLWFYIKLGNIIKFEKEENNEN